MRRSFVLAPRMVMFDQSFVRCTKQNKQTNRNAIRHMSTAVVVDLRSDTVTRPSALMRARMSTADVGDDVYQEDPTVSLLECTIACMFGKESALFFPTGTMGNLAAVLAWCDRRGCEVVAGDRSHVVLFEQCGVSQFGGVAIRTVPNLPDGSMDVALLRAAVRDPFDFHEPRTGLIALESTHCACGGAVVPIEFLREAQAIARAAGVRVHLDGARLWNALAAGQQAPTAVAACVDSLSVCFSKGLGAPAGSVLAGPSEFVERARRVRKALGGGMRQAGVLAAACLQGLADFHRGVLLDDHRRAAELAGRLTAECGLTLVGRVQTNILFVQVLPQSSFKRSQTAHMVCERLKLDCGVLASAWSGDLVRMVVHRDVTDDDVATVVRAWKRVLCESEPELPNNFR